MPKVSSYTKKTRELTIPFEDDDDEPLHVTYRPRGLTTRILAQVHAAQKDENVASMLYATVPSVLESWDLTNEDGVPIPITEDDLADLPSTLLLHVLNAVSEDIRPNPARSSTSPNGSAPTATEDRVPTGSSSFD
jgi:hypothetical protein